MAGRGVLAQTARSSPLPLQARAEIASFLELFSGVPATTRVLQELCSNPVNDQELLVHALAPDARVVLSWITQEAARGRRMFLGVSANWQQWIATSEPWSVDLQMLPVTSGHVREVAMAGLRADFCPAGLQECLAWANRTWQAAVLGPCARCQTQPTQTAVPDQHRALRQVLAGTLNHRLSSGVTADRKPRAKRAG